MTAPTNQSAPPSLRPHQQQFVERILRSDAKPAFVLKAPQGFGKGVAIAEVVCRQMAASPAMPVLIVAPRPLAEQYRYMLQRQGLAAPCILLDRASLRLFSEFGGLAAALSSPSVVLVSYEFARLSDVAEALASVRWRMVVCEEAHRLSGSATTDALARIFARADRRLLASAAEVRGSLGGVSADAVEEVEWKESDLDGTGRAARSSERRRVYKCRFALSQAEQAIFERGRAFAQHLGSEGVEKLAFVGLFHALYAGPISLSNLLEQWLRPPASGDLADASGSDDGTDEFPSDERVSFRFRLQGAAREEAAALLAAAESVPEDSRLQALVDALGQTSRDAFPAIVLVRDRFTAFYLSAALQDAGFTSEVLHSGTPLDAEFLRGPEQWPQVLVATSAGLREGISMVWVESVIVYEPLATPAAEWHLARFDRFGRQSALNVFELHAEDLIGAQQPQVTRIEGT
jgi:hypothetical protein